MSDTYLQRPTWIDRLIAYCEWINAILAASRVGIIRWKQTSDSHYYFLFENGRFDYYLNSGHLVAKFGYSDPIRIDRPVSIGTAEENRLVYLFDELLLYVRSLEADNDHET